jgi:hypothetical protein
MCNPQPSLYFYFNRFWSLHNIFYRLQSTIADIKYPFNTQAAVDPLDIQIVNVTATDQSTIRVYFNKPLDFTATNANLYSVLGVSQTGYLIIPTSVYYNSAEPYKVTLFMPLQNPLSSSNTYTLRVQSGIQDQMSNMLLTNKEMSFSGSSDTIVKPLFYQAKLIAKDTILLKSNKPILLNGLNIANTNYSLEYTENATTKTKISGGVSAIDVNTLVLKFEPLDYNIKYTLKFAQLTDFSGNFTRTAVDGLTSIGIELGK